MRIISNAPQIIKDFLVYMEIIKGKSPKTVDEYYIDLRTFFRFMKKVKGLVSPSIEFINISIEDLDIKLIKSVTLSDIYEYMNYISSERGNNANTRCRKVSSLRSYYNYLTNKAGVIKDNPAKELDSPKKKVTLPKHLTLEESIDLLNAIDGKNKERDYCIITLFLNCGMRLSELVGLNIKDVNFVAKTLKVIGKGNKERIIYLNDACCEALKDYYEKRPEVGLKDKNAIFISRLMKRISPKTVQFIIYKYIDQAGLDGKGLSTHKLRHTAATLMFQHGKTDIRVLQKLLGHENLGTTQIYTHVSDTQLQDAANSSPLAKVKMRKSDKEL
jgi:site-specific recombinase XerD